MVRIDRKLINLSDYCGTIKAVNKLWGDGEKLERFDNFTRGIVTSKLFWYH